MSSEISNSYIGVGLYRLSDASLYMQVPKYKLTRWMNGYTTHRGIRSPAIFQRDFSRDIDGIVSFLDMLELKFVAMFRSYRVSMSSIRAAAAAAKELFGTEHPFAVRRFDTDGYNIFATLLSDTSDDELIIDLKRMQFAMETLIKPFFKQLDYANDDALRFWPEGKSGYIVLDPEHNFGKPILEASGTPTYPLYRLACSGRDTYEEIADAYAIETKAVKAAVEYEARLRLVA